MTRNSDFPRRAALAGKTSPAVLATLTVIGLTVAGVAALGSLTKRKQSGQSTHAPSATRARGEQPVDPFASLPREEWDATRRESRLRSPSASDEPAQSGERSVERERPDKSRPLPEITGAGWTGALEAGRLADAQLERASALRGEVDIDIYKAEARRAKQLYERALKLGAPILEALGDEASGTGVERRMSSWTKKLVALKKTTGL